MKFPIIFICTILLISCNKDGEQEILFNAGSPDNMEVNYIQQYVDATLPPGITYSDSIIKVDLDGDGSNDLRFTSLEDSTYTTVGFLFKQVKVEIINDQYDLAIVPNSGLAYENYWVEQDYYGTFPRETHFHELSCTNEPGFIENTYNAWTTFNTVRYFNLNESVSLEDLNWSSPYGSGTIAFCNMNKTAYETSAYDFTSGGDSIVGYHYISPEFCYTPVEGQAIYLVFRKTFGANLDYGWIQIQINETDQLHINSAAFMEV